MTASVSGFTFPRQQRDERRCLAGYFRPAFYFSVEPPR
jgi:hypothetical protein